MIKLGGRRQGSPFMAGLRERELEHSFTFAALPRLRALPDDSRKTLQGDQRLTGIRPFLQLLDRDMIERLSAGTADKQRAGDVDHVRGARTFVTKRRAAALAKTSRGFRRVVLETRDLRLAAHDTKALAPAPDIGRVCRAMRAPA